MAESKHTPGPWKWCFEEVVEQWCLGPGVLVAAETDGTPDGDERDRANAGLLEAAPDLHDIAVRFCVREILGSTYLSIIEPKCGFWSVELPREMIPMAQRLEAGRIAALAKAEGRNA